MSAVTRFLEELSLPGAPDNLKRMVTPNLYDYIHSQLYFSAPFRPKFRIDPDSIRAFPPKTPYILLGHPLLYELREHVIYGNEVDPPEDFGIDKVRIPTLEDDPKEFAHINKFQNVAIVYSGHYPMPEPFTYWGLFNNFIQYGRTLVAYHLRKGTLDPHALADSWYPGDELSFIVDIPMEAMIGLDIVNEDGQVIGGQNMERRKFVVTLRSNHVVGRKFSSDSVRWFIDDFNLTTRRIKWGEPLPDPEP